MPSKFTNRRKGSKVSKVPQDSFYSSREWRRLRSAALKRDNHRCVACGRPARTVDHIKRRKDGGADALHNLRSLCDRHDRSIKESASGKRARGGVLIGCDASGVPLDRKHPWYVV